MVKKSRVRDAGVSSTKRASKSVLLDSLKLDVGSNESLYTQLYMGIKTLVLAGNLVKGDLLPSIRVLAQDLGVSRNTVITAFDRLCDEGYVENRTRSGMFVAGSFIQNRARSPNQLDFDPFEGKDRQFSARGNFILTLNSGPDIPATEILMPGVPGTDMFPHTAWRRAATKAWRSAGDPFLGASQPFGLLKLRQQIARHIGMSRGVKCDPEQILVLSSSREAIYLSALVLADPGDVCLLEEPGFLGAQAALSAADLALMPLDVDAQGMIVDEIIERAPKAKLVYITPSNQFPLGGTMSSERRSELLDWANKAKAWILEDDYDGEFYYDKPSVQALQGMDTHARVLYIGTFSKSLYLGLRLAYIVVPQDLVEVFAKARTVIAAHAATDSQAILASFIESGHFQAHVRKMREVYIQRRDTLVSALQHKLPDVLEIHPTKAGLQLATTFKTSVDDHQFCRDLKVSKIGVLPLSRFYLTNKPKSGLLIGFASTTEEKIVEGIDKLAAHYLSSFRPAA